MTQPKTTRRPRRTAAVAGASDHRTRTGRARSDRMRSRIIASAVPVFAQLGPDAPVIDDFITAAGIARGTFYRHFKSTEELLIATSNWMEDALIAAIRERIALLDEPEERLATGVRLWLQRSRADAVLCGFVVRSRFRAKIVESEVTVDLGEGIRRGRLRVASAEVGRDLLIGTVREAMSRMIAERVTQDYVDQVARTILRGLGLDARSIERLMKLPVTVLEPVS